MTSTDDLRLLREYAVHGSEDAFRKVMERHLNFVHAAALRRVRNPELAREVSQAVFIVLARKAGRLRDDTILSAWLFRSVRFAALQLLRTENRRLARECLTQEPDAVNAAGSSMTPSDDVWKQLEPELDESLARLAPKHREAIFLRFFEGQTFGEMGGLLGISEDAAKKRIVRALECLRRQLQRRRVVIAGLAAMTLLYERSGRAAPADLVSSTTLLLRNARAAEAQPALQLADKIMKTLVWIKIRTALSVALPVIAGLSLLPSTWPAPNPGNLDQGFIRTNAPGLVLDVAVQADGKLLVISGTPGFVRNGGRDESCRTILRLNRDGTVDPSFQSSTSYIPDSLALQPDGRIIVGGSQVQNNTARRAAVFQLLPDGMIDDSFQVQDTELDTYLEKAISVNVSSVRLDRDGNILATGTFLQFAGSPEPGSVRLRAAGDLDSGFQGPGRPGDQPGQPFFQSDGRAVLTLWELSEGTPPHPVWDSRTARIVRLQPDGSLDRQFKDPSPTRTLILLAVQPDDRLICTEYPIGASKPIVRLNPDGSRDPSFRAAVSAVQGQDMISFASVRQALVQPDGKVLVVGVFNRANGHVSRGLARFNPDGSVDQSFQPGRAITELNGANFQALALQGDGRIVVGGSFVMEGATQRVHIARFLGDAPLRRDGGETGVSPQ